MAYLSKIYGTKLHATMNNVTCKIILRSHSLKKSDELSVNAQFFVNKERLVVPLGFKINIGYFNSQKQMIKSNHPHSLAMNGIIADLKKKSLEIVYEANKNEEKLCRETFRDKLTASTSAENFISFAFNDLEKRRITLSPGTYKLQKSSLKKLKEYKSHIPFTSISPSYLEGYENFLRKIKGNNNYTANTALKVVRTYMYRAKSQGIRFSNPFEKFKIKKGESQRVYLTIEEQMTLIDMLDNKKYPENTGISLLLFLFSMYTSLRISDIKKFNEKMVVEDKIKYVPQKTKAFDKVIEIKLNDISKRLLPQILDNKGKFQTEQKINRDLKLIGAKCKFNKQLHFHVARHTFATTFLLIGGGETSLQQLMGHSSYRTTMIYVHAIDKRKDIEMDNFNKLFQ